MVLLSLFHVRHTPVTEMYVSLSQQVQVLIASAKVLFSWREARSPIHRLAIGDGGAASTQY